MPPHDRPAQARDDRARTARAIDRETLGAWLIKGNPAISPLSELVETAFSTVTSRCVRPSYRTDLVEAGQRVLFWISGGDPSLPAGLYARGRTTGQVEWRDIDGLGERGSEDRASTLVIPVQLAPLDPPILRTEIVDHEQLARIEVVAMAAGSNPSYLTRQQLLALESRWPQVRCTEGTSGCTPTGGETFWRSTQARAAITECSELGSERDSRSCAGSPG